MKGAGSTRRGAGPRSRSGTRREGDDFQDIVAIEMMLDWLGSGGLFRWIKVEADDALHLDDITALKADRSRLYRQVKLSTNPTDPDDRWDWDILLDKKQAAPGKKGGKSLLEKWARSVESLTNQGGTIDAAVVTNRGVRGNLAAAVSADGAVDYEKIAPEARARLEGQLGSEQQARGFFATFRFEFKYPGLQELDAACRRRFDRLGGTDQGWTSLKEAVGVWVCRRDEPRRGGRIYLSDIHRAAGWYLLHSVPQGFEVPDVYVPPPVDFRHRLEDEILRGDRGCTVVTGAPGSGKSTFASDLYGSLRAAGVPVIRHHYYLLAPGDVSPYQRADSRLAAESLMHDLEVDYPASLGDLPGRNPVPSPDALRVWLIAVGRHFEEVGKRLVVVLDGLDHVWTERRSSEPLGALLGPLLPPPLGVHFLLVTQPVSDDRLPHKLLATAPRETWLELPRLDEEATESWLIKFLQKTLAPGQQPNWTFSGQRADFAAALQRHSKGHPLHLRYTLLALLDRQLPLTTYSLERMPEYRPEGIAGYYRSLWGTLGRAGQDALHLVTACGFALPAEGIIRCLENAGYSRSDAELGVRDVGYLLEASGEGMRPYHTSLVVHVREQPDHGSRRDSLLHAALRWLKEAAPDEFRWAHAWALEADLGEPRQLIDGLTRPWLVEAVADLRPVRAVEALISRGLWHAASCGELDALVRIALLCDYSIAAFEYRPDLVSSLVPTLLAADETGRLASCLAREADTLHPMSLRHLARDAARRGDRSLAGRVLGELRRRAHSRSSERSGPDDSREIHDTVVAIGALSDAPGVQEAIRIATRNHTRGFASRILAIAARELRLVGDGRGLRELLQRLSTAGLHPDETRTAIREAVLHSLEAGWSPPAGSLPVGDPATRIHAALRGGEANGQHAYLPDIGKFSNRDTSLREWSDSREDLFRDTFLAMLANHLLGEGDAGQAWAAGAPEGTWLGGFLAHLNEVASQIAPALQGAGTLTFGRLYEALERYPRPVFRGNHNIEEWRLAGCATRAVAELGFDLVAIARGAGLRVTITPGDIAALRSSTYHIFPEWMELYGEFGRPLLASGAWHALLDEEEASLTAETGPLPERARQYSLLARIAAVEGELADARRLVRAAAGCMVAHGDHKDMLLTGVLRSVDAVCESGDPADPESLARLRDWVIRLAPPLVFVLDYTDGDETGHLPGDLAEALARIAPELLPAYHGWLAGCERYDHALTAFAEYLRGANLEDPIARAVAGTAVESRTLLVLEKRAEAGDVAARRVIDGIHSIYGPVPARRPTDRINPDPLARPEDDPPPPDPAEFPPERLESYLAAIQDLYSSRDHAISNWARHWEAADQPEQVLDALERAYSHGHHLPTQKVAYEIARSLGDRVGAFRWLIRAYCEPACWCWFAVRESEVTPLWDEVRSHYCQEWLVFLRDTIRRYGSIETPSEPWRGTSFGHSGFERLVKFCLALGERGRAFEVAEAVVRHSLEYLSPLCFPLLPWIPADHGSPAEDRDLVLLFDRLTWPSALVRERACEGIATLLRDARVGAVVATRLTAWASRQQGESIQALAILACCRAGDLLPGGEDQTGPRLSLADLKRSVLAESLCERLPSFVEVSFDTRPVHSGDPPPGFAPPDFFTDYVTRFLPPLFLRRADAAERLGCENLIRQWAYEWQVLRDSVGAPLSTRALNYWFSSSSYREPCRSADPSMSELFRSAYLRAIAWALERRSMPSEGARFLAGETCPVDLELWKIRPDRRPSWWPAIEPSALFDSAPQRMLAQVKRLHMAAASGGGPWGEGWIPAQARGRISAGDAVYDLELVAFLQACTGPEKPTTDEVSRLLDDDFLFPADIVLKEHELSFRGAIRPIVSKSTIVHLRDWKILPLCGKTWAPYPFRWQWWRLYEMVWLPLVYDDGPRARFSAEENEIVIRSGAEVIGRWRDWTDGVEENLAHELTPPAGAWLLVRRDRVNRLTQDTGMRLAWMVRITCFERKDSYEKYTEHKIEEILEEGTIARYQSLGDGA